MNILLTGGLGYIGSHISVELILAGHKIFIIDNFSNSNNEVLLKIKKITQKKFFFQKVDLLNKIALIKFFKKKKIDLVIHLAGSKSVEESENNLIKYYNNNIVSSLNLFDAMNKNNVKNIIFSSSATVYGYPKTVPIKENHIKKPYNTYGFTKSIIEELIIHMGKKNLLNYVILRYFNPVGFHKSGILTEKPKGIPTNLFPYILEIISGKLNFLKIYGKNYNTIDGSPARDYIHIEDLVNAHIVSINLFKKRQKTSFIFNIGTGISTTVLDVVNAIKKYSNISIKYKFFPRRKGDVPEIYNDISLAKKKLKWKSKKTMKDICLSLNNLLYKNI